MEERKGHDRQWMIGIFKLCKIINTFVSGPTSIIYIDFIIFEKLVLKRAVWNNFKLFLSETVSDNM